MTNFVSNDWRDRCLDCDVCVYSINEYYMVNDDVWAEAGMKQPDYSGQLCISCLEVRLNRELRSYDFSDFPINKENKPTRKRNKSLVGYVSELLYARLNGLTYIKEPESKASSV